MTIKFHPSISLGVLIKASVIQDNHSSDVIYSSQIRCGDLGNFLVFSEVYITLNDIVSFVVGMGHQRGDDSKCYSKRTSKDFS